MKVEVDVISRETIKPSSPTPDHLRHYQLSFLDQISPQIYMPLVLYYERDDENYLSNIERSKQLKKSLSEALNHFYPLAGRLNDNLFVDCNDEGVDYVEARAKCQLSEVIRDPVPSELNKFLPYLLGSLSDSLLGIQVNFFDCGGIAIGLCFSHKVADALSLLVFIKSWAATACGASNVVCPQFESAKLFPPRNLSGYQPGAAAFTKENFVTKRFVFKTSMIDALEAKYGGSTSTVENQKRRTPVQALSAFIWTRFVAATRGESEREKIHAVVHAINLRTRMDPPLPEYSFGNLYRVAVATPSMDTRGDFHGLINLMRDEIRKINKDYIATLQEGNEHLNFMRDRAQSLSKGEVVPFNFTSLCGFPLYKSNFGWGKPAWVSSTSVPMKNLVSLFDTESGDGIEAWIHLTVEDMAKLESDEEFLAFVSPTAKDLGH